MRALKWSLSLLSILTFCVLADAQLAHAVPVTYYINNQPLLLNAGGSPTCSNCVSGVLNGSFTWDAAAPSNSHFSLSFTFVTSADATHSVPQGTYIGAATGPDPAGTTCTSVSQGAHSISCTSPSGTVSNFGEISGHPGYFSFVENQSGPHPATRLGGTQTDFSCSACIFASTTPVPEPTSLGLLLSGIGGLGLWRYRSKKSVV